MKHPTNLYKRHRFPSEIIQYAVWLYHRFNMSHRDIEDLLAEKGISVSYESVRLWCKKFGPKFARRLQQRHQGLGRHLISAKNYRLLRTRAFASWKNAVA
jgi:transposase-like protein